MPQEVRRRSFSSLLLHTYSHTYFYMYSHNIMGKEESRKLQKGGNGRYGFLNSLAQPVCYMKGETDDKEDGGGWSFSSLFPSFCITNGQKIEEYLMSE